MAGVVAVARVRAIMISIIPYKVERVALAPAVVAEE